MGASLRPHLAFGLRSQIGIGGKEIAVPETRRVTSKHTVADLHQLYTAGQLNLAPEFQRNSVWPRRAKAYLIDSLLADRPIPVFFFERHASAQTGRIAFSVIDGQQRLRAIFEFLDDQFRLTESEGRPYEGLRFSELDSDTQRLLLEYDLLVEQLLGYTDREIRDVFIRLNRFVARLAPQELRHADTRGAFHDFVERIGAWSYWRERRIFSDTAIARMRPVEFAAELAILLVEGPQDKKRAIDLYYEYFEADFPDAESVEDRLTRYFGWIDETLDVPASRFRRSVELYGLIGALDGIFDSTGELPSTDGAHLVLSEFEHHLGAEEHGREAARYLLAASRQTDNLAPRATRIDILRSMLERV